MLIDELIHGQSITFLVTINGQFLSFESEILDVYPRRRLVLAKAIYHNDKIISFGGQNVSVDVLVTFATEKPQLFKNVTVNTMRKGNGELCYNLATSAESKPYNRREHFRCYVGVPTVVQFGPNQSPEDAVIRDVSISGFAVTCSKDVAFKPNQVIHALFQDYINELDEQFSMHLYGMVVRMQKLENGKYVYGCRFNSPVNGLDSYINKKERVRLRKTSGGRL